MWNKDQGAPSQTNPSASTPAAPPAVVVAPSRATTIIGETMRIKGDISSAEELQLDGEIEGRLELRNRLTIGPKGKAKATITATEVIVSGAVQGNVDAAERVILRKGANLVGDVKTAGIIIEDGAYFKGGIDIARPEAAKAAASSASKA
jgi:cytoskeletal protein CcmA (bactofilin family)